MSEKEKLEKANEYAFVIHFAGGYSMLLGASTLLKDVIDPIIPALAKQSTTTYVGHAEKMALMDVLDAILPGRYTLLSDMVGMD